MPQTKRVRARAAAAEALDLRIGALERLLHHNEQTCEMLAALPATGERQALLATNRASRARLTEDLASARRMRADLLGDEEERARTSPAGILPAKRRMALLPRRSPV